MGKSIILNDVTPHQWLEDFSNEDHHKINAISSSHLKFIASGGSMYAYYKKYIEKKVKEKFMDEFRIGTIAHLAVLEPEKFEKTVFVCDLNQSTKAYKEFLRDILGVKTQEKSQEQIDLEIKIEDLTRELPEADTKEQSKVIKEKIKKCQKQLEEIIEKSQDFNPVYTKTGGILNSKGEEIFVVKFEEMEMYRTFQRRIEDHPRISVMLHGCIIEQSGIARDLETGLWLSVRGDARNDFRGYFADPKTISSGLTRQSITQYCTNFHLPLQHAHYIDTSNKINNIYTKFFFIFMSKTPPFEIALVKLDDYDVQRAMQKRREILNKIAECKQKNRWPAADFDENFKDYGLKIKLPDWSYRNA